MILCDVGLAPSAVAAALQPQRQQASPRLRAADRLCLIHFSRDFVYVYWNVPTCSPIRIFIFGRRYVPILKSFLRCFKNRSFGSVEAQKGLEIVPDILTQNFLEIIILTTTGAGTAGPSKNGRIFLDNRKSRGANLQVCCRRDELGLATPTSRRPL